MYNINIHTHTYKYPLSAALSTTRVISYILLKMFKILNFNFNEI